MNVLSLSDRSWCDPEVATAGEADHGRDDAAWAEDELLSALILVPVCDAAMTYQPTSWATNLQVKIVASPVAAS